MTNRSHRNPIVDFKNLLPRLAEGEKQNAIAVPKRCDGTAGRELCLDILAAIGDGFDPTIRLFDHATVCLNTAAILLSGKVVMPSRDTILMSG